MLLSVSLKGNAGLKIAFSRETFSKWNSLPLSIADNQHRCASEVQPADFKENILDT